MTALEQQLLEALKAASAHLDYIGYGDAWERSVAEWGKLAEKIDAAIEAAEKETV